MLTPILRGLKFAAAAPGALTDIFAADLSPGALGAFRVTVSLAAASVLNVTIFDGSTTKSAALNNGAPLSAGFLYTFTFGVSPDLDYNFQVVTNVAVDYLLVDEVQTGVL